MSKHSEPNYDSSKSDIADIVGCIGTICTSCIHVFTSIGQDYDGEHHGDLDSFLAAAKSGCHVCGRLAKKFRVEDRKHDWEGSFPLYFQENHRGKTFGTGDVGMTIFPPNKPSAASLTLHLQDQVCCDSCIFNHGMLQSMQQERLWQPNLGLSMVWLTECLRDHHGCRIDEDPTFQPPRLICLLNNVVHLVDLKKAGRYATLSYCWGPNPNHLRLATENIDSFRKEIPDEDLPKTFRDAFACARALGVWYIWIDSLCILQSGEGSAEDWDAHLTLMASIYNNCVVNLSASSSENAYGGLGLPIKSLAHTPLLSLQVGKSNERKIFAIDGPDRFDPDSASTRIIDTRGWVAQERILSPRVLDFADGMVSWQCSQGVANESWPFGRRDDGNNFMLSWRDLNPSRRVKAWESILMNYSNRNLTKATDKFPALAGIMVKIGESWQDQYFAGHFKSTLPQSLLWQCLVNASRVDGVYLAPSWSWGSIVGPILLNAKQLFGKVVAHVHDVQVQLADRCNPFGTVTSGAIVLVGPLLEDIRLDFWARYDRDVALGWKSIKWGKDFPEDLSNSWIQVSLDMDQQMLEGQIVSFFAIVLDSVFGETGLVLMKAGQGTFKRVGVYQIERVSVYPTELGGEVHRHKNYPQRKIEII
ncbi:heterokaryon incompatibility protein-domain-containing protein [Hyaloscypha sp. PMI_1271]|nr:heterokaryon incompatibility protein-domain-containing protein [Hyaloscypha sp. PMI_1271]